MNYINMMNRNAFLTAGVVAFAALAAGAQNFDFSKLGEKQLKNRGVGDRPIDGPSLPSPMTSGRSYPATGCAPLEAHRPLRHDWDGSVSSTATSGVTWVLCPILLDMPDSTSLFVNVDMSGGWDRPGLGCYVQRTQFTWNGIDDASSMFAKRDIPNMNEYSDDIWDANAGNTSSWSGSTEVHGNNDIDTRAVLICALDRAESQYTSRSSVNGYYVEERKALGVFVSE